MNKKSTARALIHKIRSGFEGGKGGADASSSLRYSTPCRPKGSPLCTVLRYPYLVMEPKKKYFKGALGANVYLFWGGSARRQSAIFWSKFSKKVLKNAFVGLFFFKFCLRRRKLHGFFKMLWESSENFWSRYPYLVTGPKNFFKSAFDANVYFVGELAPTKRNFLVEIFRKVSKKNLKVLKNLEKVSKFYKTLKTVDIFSVSTWYDQFYFKLTYS